MENFKGILLSLEDREWNDKTFGVAMVDDGEKPVEFSVWSKSIREAWKGQERKEIEFEYNKKGNYNVVENSINPEVKGESKVKSGKDDDMKCLPELLDELHKMAKDKFLSIATREKYVDYDKCKATFKAEINISDLDGKVRILSQGSGHADESKLKNENMKEYWYVMAETRAIVRALRWATNSGTAAAEEINKKLDEIEEKIEGTEKEKPKK